MAVPQPYGVDPALRVGDPERQAVVEDLRTHCGAGRLSLDEFEERAAVALAARTAGELADVVRDLPHLRAQAPSPTQRTRSDVGFSIHVGIWIVLSLFWIGIWLATGANYFWPVFPILGFGVSVGIHAAVRQAVRSR